MAVYFLFMHLILFRCACVRMQLHLGCKKATIQGKIMRWFLEFHPISMSPVKLFMMIKLMIYIVQLWIKSFIIYDTKAIMMCA